RHRRRRRRDRVRAQIPRQWQSRRDHHRVRRGAGRRAQMTPRSIGLFAIAIILLACAPAPRPEEPQPTVKMLPTPKVELSPPPAPEVPEIVALPAPSHPNVAVRIAFRAGAVDDP